MVWYQFFLRSQRSLRRSFLSTLMLFGFPIIFFIVFGVLLTSGNERQLANIAVAADLSNHAMIVKLRKLEGVEVDVIDAETAQIDFNNGKYAAYIEQKSGVLVAQVDMSQQKIFALIARAAQADNVIEKSGSVGAITFKPTKVESSFIRYAIPGLFGLALIQLAIYAIAMPLLMERAKGALRLFAMLPVPITSIFIGEALSRAVFAIGQICLLFMLMVVVLDFDFVHSLFVIIPIFALAIVMAITIGFAIGGCISDERWGIHLLTFLNLYMLFFGNIFGPVSTVPGMRFFVLINPMTYAADAIRWATTGIPGSFPLSILIIMMVLWALVALLVSRCFFKFETVTTE